MTALVQRGLVRSEAWCRAFERVPRHPFAPRFYHRDGSAGPYELINGSQEGQRQRWLALVYDPDEPLITEYDPQTRAPTSSSSAPAIMAPMLEALGVEDRSRVLEIGTGTGYNAALLCERLGSGLVTTIDIGDGLVDLARRRLAALGYTPTAAVADGFHGHAANAPYDRVVGTCTVRRVPRAWVDQTTPAGRILAVVPDGMVTLTVAPDGSASGSLSTFRAWFMQMQDHSPASPPEFEQRALVQGEGERREVRLPLRTMLGGEAIPAFFSIARLLYLPFMSSFYLDDDRMAIVSLDDLSWVLVEVSEGIVTQGGPRRLWDRMEELYVVMDREGRPGRDRFGWTVRPDGEQYLWLDRPDSEHTWSV